LPCLDIHHENPAADANLRSSQSYTFLLDHEMMHSLGQQPILFRISEFHGFGSFVQDPFGQFHNHIYFGTERLISSNTASGTVSGRRSAMRTNISPDRLLRSGKP
jgi:hypothetical protein